MDSRIARRYPKGLGGTLLLRVVALFVFTAVNMPYTANCVRRVNRQLEPSLEATVPESPERPEGHQQDDYYSCPYIVHGRHAADALKKNKSAPGNTVTVTSLHYGRLGNHFHVVVVNFGVAYCCKSRLLTLPWRDDLMHTKLFAKGKHATIWFDLSGAPDIKDFNSSTCTVDLRWGYKTAFHLSTLVDKNSKKYNPDLARCAKSAPRLIGCEQAYLFPQGLAEICPEKTFTHGLPVATSVEGDAGHLVIHIRSGDIFGKSDPHPGYGQPPLKYYLLVMKDRPWKKIDVVTYAKKKRDLHPAVLVLQELVKEGAFGATEVNIHTDRSLDDDLRSMICADALATAKSTLIQLSAYHTVASTVYTALSCDFYREETVPIDRPGVEVFGVAGVENYTPFYRWYNTLEQRQEMVTFDNITLERC